MAPSPRSRLTPRQKLHKQAIGSGWSFINNPRAGPIYSKAATHSQAGARRTTPPLPAGWAQITTRAGPRYQAPNYPDLKQSTMPTGPVETHPDWPQVKAEIDRVAALKAGDEKPKGSAKPKQVVSAKGLLSTEAAAPRTSGGAQLLTTPTGLLSGATVKKKTLLGS